MALLVSTFCFTSGGKTLQGCTDWGIEAAEPDVFTAETVPALKWGDCNEEGLVTYLVGEKNFSEERVRSAIRKLNANKGKSSQGMVMSGAS